MLSLPGQVDRSPETVLIQGPVWYGLRTTRPKDNSTQDNSPQRRRALRQVAPHSEDNSPHSEENSPNSEDNSPLTHKATRPYH